MSVNNSLFWQLLVLGGVAVALLVLGIHSKTTPTDPDSISKRPQELHEAPTFNRTGDHFDARERVKLETTGAAGVPMESVKKEGPLPHSDSGVLLAISGNHHVSGNLIGAQLQIAPDATLEEIELEIHRAVGGLYRSLGFAKMQITDLRISPGNPPAIELQIDEGSIYRLGEVTFKGLELFDPVRSRSIFTESGNVVDYAALKSGIAELKNQYRDRGYLDASVFPELTVDDASNSLRVNFNINEGIQYRIGQISAPPGLLMPFAAGDRFYLGLLRNFLIYQGFPEDSLSFVRYPESGIVDVVIG